MPVQIMELVIKTIVEENRPVLTQGNKEFIVTNEDRGEMVKLCVEEVLRILKEKEDR